MNPTRKTQSGMRERGPDGKFVGKHTQDETTRRLDLGTLNMVKCANVTAEDRVLIITDNATRHITDRIRKHCEERGAKVQEIIMENVGERPITSLSDTVAAAVREANPTVSFLAAVSKEGELGFRKPLIGLLVGEIKVRHYHMPGLSEEIVCSDAMCGSFEEMHRLTHAVYDVVKNARTIRVTSPEGTDITVTLDPTQLKWHPDDGNFKQGGWGNLPAGEVFTSPVSVDGTYVTRSLGDSFSTKYGYLKTPVTIQIKNGRAVSVTCDDQRIAEELIAYLANGENAARVGEFAIGTNTGVTRLIGNMLIDEKAAGVHIAFGDPLGEHTGATWKADNHCDMVTQKCTIVVDGRTIMQEGKFLI